MTTNYRITAPVSGYTGTVAGVTLANGTAETASKTAIAYFRRHGYTVEAVEEAPAVEATEDDDQGPGRPVKSATKADWKAYAIAQGVSEEDAEAATRDQLAERYADGGAGA